MLSWAVGTTKLEGVMTIVPPFDSVRAVQDKIAARATLERLGIAQPPSTVLHDLDELAAAGTSSRIHQDADRDRDFWRSHASMTTQAWIHWSANG